MSSTPPSEPPPNDDADAPASASGGAVPEGEDAAARRKATGKERTAKVSDPADATASLDDEIEGLVADLSGGGGAARPSRTKGSSAGNASKGGRRRGAADRERSDPGPEGATLAPPEEAPELSSRREAAAGRAESDLTGVAARQRGLRGIELAGLGGIGLILVALVVFLIGFADRDVMVDASQRPARDVPSSATGDLAVLDEVEAYWRPRSDDDRVDQRFGVLPVVRLGLDDGTPTGTHYLKIHFLDTGGRITGDVRTARIENGRFVDTGRGERIGGDGTLDMPATAGMVSETAFVAYRFSDEPRWSVEIFEGEDYSAGPWTRIAWFEMPGDLRDAGTPAASSGAAP